MAKLLLVLAAFAILSAVVLSLPQKGNGYGKGHGKGKPLKPMAISDEDNDEDGNNDVQGDENDNAQKRDLFNQDELILIEDVEGEDVESESDYQEDDLSASLMTRICPDLNANRPNGTALTFIPLGCLIANMFGFGR